MGGEDLFRVVLGADNVWGYPENLGYPINTSADETNLFIALNGKTAYFSKRKNNTSTGKADVDIHEFDLPEAIRPAPATYLEANITDAVTGKPLSAVFRLRPLLQDAPPLARQTDESGYLLAVLPAGKDYALTVAYPGYLFYSDRFSLASGYAPDEPYHLEIKLQPVAETVMQESTEEDGAIAFRNVLFATGSANLLPVSADELDRLATLLNQAPDYDVEIAGHTDNVGTEEDNLLLSQQRAASVKAYLVDQGIGENRINTLGYGETRPVDDNATEEGRAKNRRTTFRLEKKRGDE
jgi:outer membrane protein OmpA-like peptidoglycan-associated protein